MGEASKLFIVKGQYFKVSILGFSGPYGLWCLSSAIVVSKQPDNWKMNGCGHVPTKLSFMYPKFEFHIILTCHQPFFFLNLFLPQLFRNVKAILHLQVGFGPQLIVCLLWAAGDVQVWHDQKLEQNVGDGNREEGTWCQRTLENTD